jgi:hypothetical protein
MRSDSGRPMFSQVAPESKDLKMPAPTETELRVHASPVPTQTVLGRLGSRAMAPMDCTGWRSNTGWNVVPPSVDFHTPPLAAPTYRVVLPPAWCAARAATRPLIAAEPMLRAPSPEITAESITVWVGSLAGGGVTAGVAAWGSGRTTRTIGVPGAGIWNTASSMGTLTSACSMA